MNKIKNILLAVWLVIGVLLHMSITIFIKYKSLIVVIIMLVVWWLITALMLNYDDKKNKMRAKEYKEKYISTEIIENDKFGKIVFEKDSKTNEVYCDEFSLPFGGANPSITIIDYDEKLRDSYLISLAEVYDNQEGILNDYYEKTKEFCDAWDEEDSDGKPLSMDYIKENLIIMSFEIYSLNNQIKITLNGCFSDDDISDGHYILGGHFITADIDCKTKEITCDLLG